MSATSPDAAWDVYREIHKAMRHALFGVTTLAGATDPADEPAVRALCREWTDVRFVLDGHHHHEDEFCDVLVAGDVGLATEVMSNELRQNLGEVVALLPLPASEASVESAWLRCRSNAVPATPWSRNAASVAGGTVFTVPLATSSST